LCFFFSSRRRHTRSKRDWSSDVCSSDLSHTPVPAAADHAKAVMQVAAAGPGVWLSDGGSNVMPTGTTAEVRSAWGLHAGLVRRRSEERRVGKERTSCLCRNDES